MISRTLLNSTRDKAGNDDISWLMLCFQPMSYYFACSPSRTAHYRQRQPRACRDTAGLLQQGYLRSCIIEECKQMSLQGERW